jgi:hypothetical protein
LEFGDISALQRVKSTFRLHVDVKQLRHMLPWSQAEPKMQV